MSTKPTLTAPLLSMALFLSTMTTLSLFSYGKTDDGPCPIKVFILAGQSNMEGQGVVAYDHEKYYNGGRGNLVQSMKKSKSAVAMKHLKNSNGKWTVRDDVKVWFKIKKGVTRGGLSVGFTGYGGKSHIGPELQFGHVIGDYFDEPVLLIKTAWGGKSLYSDFRPPSSGGKTGPFYTQMLGEIREALGEMKSLFPDRKNTNYEIAGFVWFQGWNDMCTKPAIPEYEQNLVNLVTDVRSEFKLPDLPVVIGELGNGGPKAGNNMLAIRKAQKNAAEQLNTTAFVVTHNFARPAENSPNKGHGHHWFGNAESYFLIGDALGKGMKKILEQQQKTKTGRVALFDGKTLDNWTILKCEAAVDNGEILLIAGNGLVQTRKQFKNFILEFEWKALRDNKWDSGVYFRYNSVPARRPWPNRYQINLRMGMEGDVSALKAARNKIPVKKGKWNHFKLMVRGTKASLELNNKPAWKAHGLANPQKGFIALQAEVPGGGKHRFRNIYITEIE